MNLINTLLIWLSWSYGSWIYNYLCNHTLVSSTNKTNCHNITNILLKVAFKHRYHNPNSSLIVSLQTQDLFPFLHYLGGGGGWLFKHCGFGKNPSLRQVLLKINYFWIYPNCLNKGKLDYIMTLNFLHSKIVFHIIK